MTLRAAMLVGVGLILGGAAAWAQIVPRAPKDDVQTDTLPGADRHELIEWAVHFSDRKRPTPDAQPAFVALDDKAFTLAVCARASFECSAVKAAYDPVGVRVIYRATLDLKDTLDRSFIVHEVVHWLQHQSGQAPDESCEGQFKAEREAYAVQNRYLTHYQRGRRVGGALAAMACPAR
jgi:hypothetical protein